MFISLSDPLRIQHSICFHLQNGVQRGHIILPFAIIAIAINRLEGGKTILFFVGRLKENKKYGALSSSVPISNGYYYESDRKGDLGLVLAFSSLSRGNSYEGDFKEGQKLGGFFTNVKGVQTGSE